MATTAEDQAGAFLSTLPAGRGERKLLEADGRKLKRIVYNLLSNAVRFSGQDGRVTLRARRVDAARIRLVTQSAGRALPPSAPRQEFVEVAAEDTGIGIAAADLARLFEPFVQVDASRTRRHEGTGLGLALVRRLIELHEGGMAVNSTPGRGSCFIALVAIPLRRSHRVAAIASCAALTSTRTCSVNSAFNAANSGDVFTE